MASSSWQNNLNGPEDILPAHGLLGLDRRNEELPTNEGPAAGAEVEHLEQIDEVRLQQVKKSWIMRRRRGKEKEIGIVDGGT
jgi:hypothetical protein